MPKADKLPPEYQMVPATLLVRAPWNFKTEDEETARRLVEKIKRTGLIQPLNVREVEVDGEARLEAYDGNHRVDAIRILGIKSVAVHNAGEITQAEAARRAMELNEDHFETDMVKVAELFRDDLVPLFGSDDLSGSLPWEQQQIDDMISGLDFDLDALDAPEAPPAPKDDRPPPGMKILSLAGRKQRVSQEAAAEFWKRFDAWESLAPEGSDALMTMITAQVSIDGGGGDD